jgi:hypothetical protein
VDWRGGGGSGSLESACLTPVPGSAFFPCSEDLRVSDYGFSEGMIGTPEAFVTWEFEIGLQGLVGEWPGVVRGRMILSPVWMGAIRYALGRTRSTSYFELYLYFRRAWWVMHLIVVPKLHTWVFLFHSPEGKEVEAREKTPIGSTKLSRICDLVMNLQIMNFRSQSCHARVFWSLCEGHS